MPIRHIDSDLSYYLIAFDEEGRERGDELTGELLSDTVLKRIRDEKLPITDVIFVSHGWLGDMPAAIRQYDEWIRAMAGVEADREAAAARPNGFVPLIVGLHWPSLPFGDETAPEEALLSVPGEYEKPLDALEDQYAARIATTPQARTAIRRIIEALHQDPGTSTLSSEVLNAYATLFEAADLDTAGVGGRPGSDNPQFDPQAIIDDARVSSGDAPVAPGVLSLTSDVRDLLLMPLRQLSFWKMKDRARRFGETCVHQLLSRVQESAPVSARFHLMGHSFGCIVVSAAVAGEAGGPPLPRPVNSLFLVQGALSLWSYANEIPYVPGARGYFNQITTRNIVNGPIVTTRSSHDTAVCYFYPLGARIKEQYVLGDEFPQYGGVGAFGIQGSRAEDFPMKGTGYAYDFHAGAIYNLDASEIIKEGSGLSGAHSDIAHAEVAHAFWSAFLSSPEVREWTPMPGEPMLGLPAEAPPPATEPEEWMLLSDASGGSSLIIESPEVESRAPQGQPTRWINVEIEDRAPSEPLEKGTSYSLAFDVDVTQRSTSAAATILQEEQLFPPGVDSVTVMVQLDSSDFIIAEHTRPLTIGRAGKSPDKAVFAVTPKHDGNSTIKATIHKDGNFIQQMDITFDVGTTATSKAEITSRGRPPAAVNFVHPREIGISISPGIDGYECVVWHEVTAHARLPIPPALLAAAIDAARHDLVKVVMYRDSAGEYVFQRGIDIPAEAEAFALRTMARAGALLFQKIFFGPGAAADSITIGSFLRKMAMDRTRQIKLQIIGEAAPVPWGLLYVGDISSDASLDWQNFIGMRHVIEQIPLQNSLSVCNSAISSDKPGLAVSVNVNTMIDTQMHGTFVAEQRAFWSNLQSSLSHMRVVERTTSSQVLNALADAATDDQIAYFYCHAASAGLTDPGGPDASSLALSDGNITLGDLTLLAPASTQLRGNPLVFINACESAEMSPAFYDGFVPYFMAKGARGIIGTECKTPALFAVAWAKRFFELFFDGVPLGEAFLTLRREFIEKHANPLGLLYAVHCDGDAQVDPPLTASRSSLTVARHQ